MKLVLRLVGAFLVCSILLFGWYRFSLSPVNGSDTSRITVKIPKGDSVRQIANLLEEKNLIRSSLAFRTYVRLQGFDTGLQAGTFILRPSLSVPEIAEALRKGISEEGIITIPEGFSVQDIDTLLADKGILAAGDFTKCAQTCDLSAYDFLPKSKELAKRGGKVEGYLYPDTYFVVVDGFTAESFLKRLLDTFQKRVVRDLAEDLKKSDRPLHEIVTMASLIEEETRKEEERATVSGILWKRFDAHAGLGVDATVRYILEKSSGALTVSDLNTNSPYNLRKFRGLPPGPIASPSLSAIKAALHPKDTPYWYYLHGTDGQIHYAETNEEHNVNKYKYLQ